MKKFIFRLSIFISILIIIIIMMECFIYILNVDLFKEKMLERCYPGIGNSYSWISKIKSNKKILLLGGSSVRYGLSCSKLNELSNDSLSFINLAMDARDPIETYFILKNIDLTNVKSAYLGLDPWVYTKRYYKYRNSYLYLDMDFFSVIKYSFEHDQNIIIKRYKAFINYLLRKKANPYIYDNEIPKDFGSVKLLGKPINFNESINKWFQIDKYGWSNLQFKYLTKIDSLCKINNINFFVFIPPKRSDFSQIYKTKCNVIHKEFVKKITQDNSALKVLGKLDQLDKVGDSDLFLEAYHLNSKGQIAYSSIFYKMMLNKKVNYFCPNYSWFDNTNQYRLEKEIR